MSIPKIQDSRTPPQRSDSGDKSEPDPIRTRQKRLSALYQEQPAAAWVVDHARTGWRIDDPLHTAVVLGPAEPIMVPVALHSAVGGDGDAAVPGDLLAGALATCFDSTLRALARRLRIELEELSVTVDAEVDVRGTLCVDPQVPVGFQRMRATIRVRCADGSPDSTRKRMLGMVEHLCVVHRTLQARVPIATIIDDSTTA